MKINFLFLCLLFLMNSCANKKDSPNNELNTFTKMEESTKQLRHVVLLNFKDDASPSDIKKVESAFSALPSKITEIIDFEWGLNNSPEELNKGFTHCFFVTFENEEGRSKYLPHPEHLAFVGLLTPYLEDVLVIDYIA